MKKHLLWMLLALAAAPFAHAQEKLCEPCQHQISPRQTYVHVVCRSESFDCDPGFTTPVIFVVVTYRRVTCKEEDVNLIIDGVVVVDDRESLKTQCPPKPPRPACPTTPDPLPPAYIKQYLNEGIMAAINALGASMQVEMFYPGSCTSWVTYRFPEKVFSIRSRGDATGSDTVWTSAESVFHQPIPCGDACCKVIYEHVIKTWENGETTMTWEPTSWESAEEKCDQSSLPNYSDFKNHVTGTSAIPPYKKVEPIVLAQTQCEVICKEIHMPPPHGDKQFTRFSTDITGVKDELKLELEAHPTLFNQYIRFSTNRIIDKVVVYDMSGRRVLQQASPAGNELNTAALKNGIYYVQVYLQGNDVKTIKVMKQ